MAINKTEELAVLKARLAEYLIAESKILRNQEYTIKDRTFKKANAAELRKSVTDLQWQIQRLTDGGMKARLVIPRNY